MRVAVVGLGVIGKAQARMFREHELVTYDPIINPVYPFDELASCDFAVICVGTPPNADGSANVEYVYAAYEQLPPTLPAIIRSTVPPGTTDRLISGTPGRYALTCHVPEFMGENKAHPWQEPTDVPYMILGGTPEARSFFRFRLAQVFPGTIHECTSLESELTKYAANLYWATRVTFVNEMAGICQTFGADWGKVRAAWLEDPRMTDAYTEMEGHPPGFGGRCWPKDLRALIHASREAGHDPRFLADIEQANREFGGETVNGFGPS